MNAKDNPEPSAGAPAARPSLATMNPLSRERLARMSAPMRGSLGWSISELPSPLPEATALQNRSCASCRYRMSHSACNLARHFGAHRCHRHVDQGALAPCLRMRHSRLIRLPLSNLQFTFSPSLADAILLRAHRYVDTGRKQGNAVITLRTQTAQAPRQN